MTRGAFDMIRRGKLFRGNPSRGTGQMRYNWNRDPSRPEKPATETQGEGETGRTREKCEKA